MANSVSPTKATPADGTQICDMAGGMAGRVEHVHLMLAEAEGVALPDLGVDARDLGGLRARPDDGAAGRRLDFQVAAGVIMMVMRGQDMRELPALGLQGRCDGLASGTSMAAVAPPESWISTP